MGVSAATVISGAGPTGPWFPASPCTPVGPAALNSLVLPCRSGGQNKIQRGPGIGGIEVTAASLPEETVSPTIAGAPGGGCAPASPPWVPCSPLGPCSPWGPAGPAGRTKFSAVPVSVVSAVTATSAPEVTAPTVTVGAAPTPPAPGVALLTPCGPSSPCRPFLRTGWSGRQNKSQCGPCFRGRRRHRRLAARGDAPYRNVRRRPGRTPVAGFPLLTNRPLFPLRPLPPLRAGGSRQAGQKSSDTPVSVGCAVIAASPPEETVPYGHGGHGSRGARISLGPAGRAPAALGPGNRRHPDALRTEFSPLGPCSPCGPSPLGIPGLPWIPLIALWAGRPHRAGAPGAQRDRVAPWADKALSSRMAPWDPCPVALRPPPLPRGPACPRGPWAPAAPRGPALPGHPGRLYAPGTLEARSPWGLALLRAGAPGAPEVLWIMTGSSGGVGQELYLPEYPHP